MSRKNQHKKKVHWTDGDSGTFSDGTRFRLQNVRAPESGQKGGQKANRVAAGMTGRSKNQVTVEEEGRDKYGRKLVKMKNKDGSINKRLRKKGYTDKGN